MVDWALVEWMDGAVPVKDIGDIEDDAHFYALLGAYEGAWDGVHLLYVGLAYDQHVVERAKQDHAAYEKIPGYLATHPRRAVFVTIGWFVARSVQRISRKFAREVESLLIHRNQPLFNSKCIENCADRPLVVMNTGDFLPFEQQSSCCDPHLEEWENDGGRAALESWL